jgi:hypothetical protein
MTHNKPMVLRPVLQFPAEALARRPEGSAPDNLLVASVRDRDIELSLLYPLTDDPEGGESDQLQLLVEGVPVGDPVTLQDYRVGDTVPITLRAADRPLDPKQDRLVSSINYRVHYASGGGGYESGPAGQSFVTDIVRPGRDSLATLLFDPRVIAEGITPETLVDDGSGQRYLPAIVKGYDTAAVGDWLEGMIDDTPRTPIRELTASNIGHDIELRFDESSLLPFDGTVHDFGFLIADRAGNVSLQPDPQPLQVSLIDRVKDLKPPVIPLFADDGLIHEDDARAPVMVDIPAYAKAKAGDVIVVFWGEAALADTIVTEPDATPVVVSVRVPYAVLQRVPERYAVDVSYEVRRPSFATRSPALTDVQVDLSLPGGPDPDPETPEMESLGRPSILGAASGSLNVITPADAELAATATLPGWSSTSPAFPAFLPGDVLQLVWNGAPVQPPYTLGPVDVGKDIPVTVASAILKSGGSGIATMHYRATRMVRDGTGNAVPNISRSPAQQVRVTIADDLPGGPGGLEEGRFPEANRYNSLNREIALSDGGTPFLVPLYVNQRLGDRIVMHFVQYPESNGSGAPIEASRHAAEQVVGPDDVRDDHTFLIPTDKLLFVESRSARASYTVTAPPGTVSSADAFVLCDMRDDT